MDTTTALAIVTDSKTALKCNEIRSKYDKAHNRWMPHINLLFPFVPTLKFDKIKELLDGKFESFEIPLTEIGFFSQKKDATFHVKPDKKTTKKLEEIYKTILTLLETEVNFKTKPFHPHLTLAQCKKGDKDAMLKELNEWLGKGLTIKFELVLLNRSPSSGDKMEIIKTISCTSSSAAVSTT
jgi:poly(A) polymerase